MGLVRSIGYLSPLSLLGIIPFVGTIVSIWYIVVEIIIVSETQKLSTGKAVGTVLIPIGIVLLFAFIIAIALIAYFTVHPVSL